jgi:Arc/MetJ-type ribon-helix-helix transcriptional regulator
MNLKLSSESEAWLRAQVQQGHFATVEEAIDYTVKLTALRETLHASIADPRRYGVDEVRANLKAHFAARVQNANAP